MNIERRAVDRGFNDELFMSGLKFGVLDERNGKPKLCSVPCMLYHTITHLDSQKIVRLPSI